MRDASEAIGKSRVAREVRDLRKRDALAARIVETRPRSARGHARGDARRPELAAARSDAPELSERVGETSIAELIRCAAAHDRRLRGPYVTEDQPPRRAAPMSPK
jgi:hypothetical protein